MLGFAGNHSTPYKFPALNFFPAMPLAESNPVTVEGANLGRYLFYDPILSSDSSMSCSSCHKQEFAFSDSPNQFSTNRYGQPMQRNTMALFNLAWYPAYFWDGRASTIEDQIFHPIREKNEMNLSSAEATNKINRNKTYIDLFEIAFPGQTIDSILISKAVAQFLRTLISNGSKYDRVLQGISKFSPNETEGFILANDQLKGDCLHCHTTDADALGTTHQFSNNGLDDVKNPENYLDKGRGKVTGKAEDNGKFIIPTLRNLAFTAPYMHDGRFKTLDEVLDFYSESVHHSSNIDSKMQYSRQGGVHLTGEEKMKLKQFLLTLTDSVFIQNPEFGKPLIKN